MNRGDYLLDFKVLSVRDVPEYRCRAVHLMHATTGLEVLHLETHDRENLFAFSFTTPAHDDTGVTHIAEHCILAGSRGFPLKEPFSVLLKGSMHTFLNAFTFPDRTVFPAASLNQRDFFNLMLVYGDAVFFPLLRKETFQQEGWRWEPAGKDRPSYAGVVYNEMKGAYSSPESVSGEWAYRGLFTESPYRFDSGGDPKLIPSLSLEALRAYHARYYHPSNCRVFFYGNIPLEEKLGFLQRELLRSFGAGAKSEPIALETRWRGPRRLEKSYPVRPSSPTEGRSTVCVSWLTHAENDPLEVLALEVLTEILVGSAGSPLGKRLIDSGLGEDLSPATGLETELRQAIFSVGLRGTDPEREGRIQELVLETLSTLVQDGMDAGLIESMINRVEFQNREIRGGGSPYALRLLRRTLRGWTHGMDPVQSLLFQPVMETLKSRWDGEKSFFEDLTEKELLSNAHRMTLVVRPDPEQEQRESREHALAIAALMSGMDEELKRRIQADADAFTAFQKRTETQEELARIPSLDLADLPEKVQIIPASEEEVQGGVPVLLHDIYTNGIVYVDLCFPIDDLDRDLFPLVPLFGKAVCGSGVPGASYADMAIELFRLTGGFHSFPESSGIMGRPSESVQYVFFRLKTLEKNVGRSLDLVSRLLREADFSDKARLKDMILELRNDQKASLIPAGHHFAALRAAGRLCASAAREEMWKGVDQLIFLEELAMHVDERLAEVASSLEKVRGIIISNGRLRANVTAPAEVFPIVLDSLESFCSGLPRGPGGSRTASAQPSPHDSSSRPGEAESLVTSATVGYVAHAIRGFHYGERMSAPQTLLGHLLSTGYLWESVRMEGGAYGAFCHPRSLDGVFLFSTYRDPHILRTFAAFRRALEMAGERKIDGKDLVRAVIGAVGKEERPFDPGDRGFVSFQRRLYGITDDLRQSHRSRLLAADLSSIAEAARILLTRFDDGHSVVISNKADVERAGGEWGKLLENMREITE